MRLNWSSSTKKEKKDSDKLWHSDFWHFSIAWFRMFVDLPIILFLLKSAIFHTIKLPFDAKVAEKFLNGIY